MTLDRPVHVYKGPYAKRKLRGLDIETIGDEHRLCDAPLMCEASVKVVATGRDRVKIRGEARAESGGDLYNVFGWINIADSIGEGMT